MISFFKKNKIYLDHAATTPLDRGVFSVMADVFQNGYFNPGGLYADGVATAKKILESRKQVAGLLGTTSNHIIFTRGGTEANNIALVGAIQKYRMENPEKKPQVIISEIEHSSVLELAKDLERTGDIELAIAPVNPDGIVDMDELKKLLQENTAVISIMYVNNEIGTIQPIKDIAKLVRWYKKQNSLKEYPLVHTDAIQAANYLDIHVERLGVDLMTLSGSKMYGPKSSGVLFVRNRDRIVPLLHGGDQEMGLRAGTEDIAQIVGFAKALEIARNSTESESARLQDLRDYCKQEIEKNIPGVVINGSWEHRIVNNINISAPGISGERLVIELDARGMCVSSKSACREDVGEESHVIAAIRKGKSSGTDGALRITLGRSTKKGDIDKLVNELVKIIQGIKEFEGLLT